MGCRKIAEYFSVGKKVVLNILKDDKKLRKDFSKVTLKSVVMESTTISMKFCTIGMKSARVQTYILMGPFFNKKLWRTKEDWTKKNLQVLQLRMDG